MYRTTNRWLLATFALLAAAIVANHYLSLTQCMAKDVFGKDCILCGCTRDFFTLLRGGTRFVNPASPFVFSIIAVEIAWRTVFSFAKAPRALVVSDIVLHGALGAFVFVANIAALMP